MDISDNLRKIAQAALPTEQEASTMSHSDLYSLRDQYANNLEVQNKLAPYEHRAFAREWVASSSPAAAASLAVAIPLYTASKVLDIASKDEQTSTNYLEEIKQGYIGVGEGLKAYFSDGETTIKKATPKQEQKVEPTPHEIADKYLAKLMDTESNSTHVDETGKLVSSEKGAQGITQIIPKTGSNPGYGVTPLKNETQAEYVRFGRDYLAAMIKTFGDAEKGIAAYNAGPAKIHRAVMKAAKENKDWKDFIPTETKNYIKKVSM